MERSSPSAPARLNNWRSAIKASASAPLAARLSARWAAPTAAQNQALGRALWRDLVEAPIADIFPAEIITPLAEVLVVEEVAREVLRHVPRGWIEDDLNRRRMSGMTLADLVGEEGAERLRRLVMRPPEFNREVVRRLLDQPILRQALRETLQNGIQQFVSEIGQSLPFSKSAVGPTGSMAKGVLGELGRGFAKRAADTARIGKTWAEGLGIGKAFEDQVQPFVGAWAQKAVGGMLDGLFSGDQAELAAEARLNALEILLETSLDELIPEPDLSLVDLRLRAAEAIAGHVAGLDGERDGIIALVSAWRTSFAVGTIGEALDRLGISRDPGDALLEAIGQMGHGALARTGLSSWLAEEVASAQKGGGG